MNNEEFDVLEAEDTTVADLQAAADEAVGEGDYAAAAELREEAEEAAATTGDVADLHGASAADLEHAADKQEEAAALQQQEAEHAAAGDYEAAQNDAFNAEWAMHEADAAAGGADHSGQAQAEGVEMDNADWHQDIADENAATAEAYAAEGDLAHAEIYADTAADHQVIADEHGDLGEHGSIQAVHDYSADTASAPASSYVEHHDTE